jgi:hypothetical protein
MGRDVHDPNCLGIGRKRAHPLLPLTHWCYGAVVETAAGPHHAPLSLNQAAGTFLALYPFVIAVPRVTPSPRVGQETRRRFVNCPLQECWGNQKGALHRIRCDSWYQR